MKKALIAGVASVALAAMPVVGVFAADTGTQKVDTLVLTIANACSFLRGDTAHASTIGTWGNDSDTTTENDDPNTLWATVLNGKFYDGSGTEGHNDALGTSNFVVTCNNQYGYQVTVAGTAFSATNTANSSNTNAWAYSKGGTLAASPSNSVWTVASSHAAASFANDAAIAAQADATVNGDTFTMTYKAYVDATQPADTYTATATYDFSQKAAPANEG